MRLKFLEREFFFKDTKSLKYNSKLSSLDEGKVLQFNKLKSHDCFLSRVNEFGQMVPEKVKPDVNYDNDRCWTNLNQKNSSG